MHARALEAEKSRYHNLEAEKSSDLIRRLSPSSARGKPQAQVGVLAHESHER